LELKEEYLPTVANRTKYGRNRQLWRKVYGTRRRKPETTSFVDTLSNETVTLDLHRTLRHRDFFVIRSTFTGSFRAPLNLAQFDDGLIAFKNTDSATANFNFCFTTTPDAVVLTVDSAADSSDNVIPYGITFNSCSMAIGLSAPFTGNVRYRAVYSSGGYPALVTSSLVPTNVHNVSAGRVTASLLPVTSYTASFDAFTAAPSTFYRTTWDDLSNCDIDVDLTLESSTSASAIGEISAPLSNSIYFIAIE